MGAGGGNRPDPVTDSAQNAINTVNAVQPNEVPETLIDDLEANGIENPSKELIASMEAESGEGGGDEVDIRIPINRRSKSR